VQTTFGFLVMTGRYTVSLPADVTTEPELGSVCAYNGAARSVVYRPAWRAGGPGPGVAPVETVTVGAGDVLIYQQMTAPQFYVGYLPLSRGFLVTYMEQELGPAALQDVFGSVMVDDSLAIGAHVTLGGAVTPGDIREITEQDETAFYAGPGAADPSQVVRFRAQPPWATEEQSTASWGSGQGVAVASNALGIRVSCEGADLANLQALAANLAEGMTVAA
jgi:hypothetical protein